MKSLVLVTLILQRPLRDYSNAAAYRDSFDWCYACPPTATTHIILLHTDTPEIEIHEETLGYIDETDDFCHVDGYDHTEGKSQLLATSDLLRQWLVARE